MYTPVLSLILPVLAAALAAAAPTSSSSNTTSVATPAAIEDATATVDYCKYQTSNTPDELTRSDLLKGTCKGKKLLLLFARGSEEPPNLGANVGLPLSRAFAKVLGPDHVAVQGVYKYGPWEYPANLQDAYQGGSESGAEAMAHLVAKWKSSCPETKLVLGGYSQGAQVAHKAVGILNTDADLSKQHLASKIDGIVLFGDPDKGQPFEGVPAGKVFEDCHAQDTFCHGGSTFEPAHLTYCKDVGSVAERVVKQLHL